MGAFSTEECAWSQTSVKLLGRTIKGIRGFEFKNDNEKEHLYAAGKKPIDIQEGNEKPEGNLKLLKYEVDLLNDAAQLAGFSSIATVPHDGISITCNYKKTIASEIRTVQAFGVAFGGVGFAMEQNAKMTEVTLAFLAMEIIFKKG